MATYRSGSNCQILIGKESAFNTSGSNGHVLRKSSVTIPSPLELITNDELVSDPNPPLFEKGLQTGTGWSITGPLEIEVFGHLLYYFFSSYSVAGASPYTHTYKTDAALGNSMFIEIGDLELTKFDIYNGIVPTSLSFSVSKTSDLMRWTMGFVGSGKYTLNGGASVDGTPTSYNERAHVLPHCSVEIDTATLAYLTGIDVTINRRVDMLQALDTNAYASDFDTGDYSVDCTINGWRDASDNLYGLDDDADHTVEIISPNPASGTYYMNLQFPEARILNTQGATIGDDGPVQYSMQVSPYYDDNASATAIMVDLVNEIASISAVA